MINIKTAKRYCRDDISKIENYEQAINDKTQTWHCHHRLELTLEGEFAHTSDELKRLGMYKERPYFELIFLTKKEHHRLHSGKWNEESKIKHKMNVKHALKGKPKSEEHVKHISEALKGKKRGPFTEEHKRKIVESVKRAREEGRWKIKDVESWKKKISNSNKLVKRVRDKHGKFVKNGEKYNEQ